MSERQRLNHTGILAALCELMDEVVMVGLPLLDETEVRVTGRLKAARDDAGRMYFPLAPLMALRADDVGPENGFILAEGSTGTWDGSILEIDSPSGLTMFITPWRGEYDPGREDMDKLVRTVSGFLWGGDD